MGADHKLLLQLLPCGFYLFCCKIGKKISVEISFNVMLLLRLSARFSYTSRHSSAHPHLQLVYFKIFIKSLFQIQNTISLS